jgi:hypothetical protein
LDSKKFWCLVYYAHLGKTQSFCKILGLKIAHLEKNFDQYSDLKSDILVPARHSKAKTTKLLHKIGCTLQEKISQKNIKNASELCN